MTTDEILVRVDEIDGLSPLLSRLSYANKWWCKMTYSHNDVKLEIEAEAATGPEALAQAFAKFTSVANVGLGRGWDVPALEHKAREAEASLDDDISF